MSTPESDLNDSSSSRASSLGQHSDLRVESELSGRSDTMRANAAIGAFLLDERESLGFEPHFSCRRKLNAGEVVEVERQQHNLDIEMGLYVDDNSTLIRCKQLKKMREITVVQITIGDDELNALRTCRSLIRISLLHCDGFDNLRVLAKITTLQVIHVFTRGPLRYIGSLNKLPVLRKLTLSCNNIKVKDICVVEQIKTLDHISLFHCGDLIYERGPNYICSTIITDDNLWELCKNRSLVKINCEGCEHLTDLSPLAAIETLEVVNMRGCRGVWNIGPLGRLSRLRELWVGGTRINYDGLRGLGASGSLVKIDLEGCKNVTGMIPLAAIKTLEYLNLSCCYNVKDIGLLGRLPHLKELYMRDVLITDEDLLGVSGSRSLMKIDISDCIRLRDVAPLAVIETMEVVNMRGCRGVWNIGPLGRLSRLRELWVGGTRISDDDLRGLSASRSLVKIDLEGCKNVTDTTPLAAIKTLEYINLSCCYNVKDIGLLGGLPHLKELYMRDVLITDEDLLGVSGSRSLVKINCEGCEHLTNVAPLAAIETLEVVNMRGCRGVWNIGPLGRLSRLRELWVGGTRISDDDLRGLSASRSLVKIDLEGCGDIADVNPLAAIGTLETVYLSDCSSVSYISALGGLPRLKQFHMRRTRITDDGLRGLGKSLSLVLILIAECNMLRDVTLLLGIQTLKEVVLDSCRNIFGVGAFGRHPVLERICVKRTPFSDDDLRGLSASRSLVKIDLLDCENLRDVAPLAAIQTLEVVNISGCYNVNDVGPLGELLKLKELFANKTAINDDSIRGLGASQSLVKIQLKGCENLRDVRALTNIQTLEEVRLTGCYNLKDIGAFGRLRNLKELCARWTNINDIGGLGASQSLVKVNLKDCEDLTDVSPLAKIQTLEEMLLNGCCNLKDIGVFGKLRNLKQLNIGYAVINDDSIRGLGASRSLVKINLDECEFLRDVSPLARLQTLEEVRFYGCCRLQSLGFFGRLRNLTRLCVYKAHINYESIRGLVASQSLVKIRLEECEYLRDVTPLAAIQTLEEVSFSGCHKISNFAVFGRHPLLRVFNAKWTNINDDGIRGLGVSRSLVKINLEGCEYLRDVTPLAAIQTLEEVSFSGCHKISNFAVFGRHPLLRVFNAKWTNINDDGIRGLGVSRSLVKINLEGCQYLTDVTPLAAIQTLEEVCLSFNDNVGNFFVFGRLPHLRIVDVTQSAINDDDLRGLGVSRSLVKINLEGCENLTDVTPLANIQTLKEVILPDCEGINGVDVLRVLLESNVVLSDSSDDVDDDDDGDDDGTVENWNDDG